MKRLSTVLITKIAFTILLWCLPLLVFPTSLLEWLGFVVPSPLIFLRLLGLAYLALTVGYVFGLHDLRRGNSPAGVIWMGIVSNGGACIALAVAAVFHAWEAWGMFAQVFMWGSLAGTAAITIALTASGPLATRFRGS